MAVLPRGWHRRKYKSPGLKSQGYPEIASTTTASDSPALQDVNQPPLPLKAHENRETRR